ncbi:MAG: response regulator transcription factor, partial [Sandaracinaceae bacterium]
TPSVVLLDVMHPAGSGLDVCVRLRRELEPTPGVVMLTARGNEADVVLGLDHGADDYVVKPCRPRELVARIRAVARRTVGETGASADLEQIVRGSLRLDRLRRRAWVGDEELPLTPTEHELLSLLVAQHDRVHSRMELLQKVFESTHPGYARNVDCHVARLKRKLERAGITPTPIKTVYGQGYRFDA